MKSMNRIVLSDNWLASLLTVMRKHNGKGLSTLKKSWPKIKISKEEEEEEEKFFMMDDCVNELLSSSSYKKGTI
ncbi:hypothetical protein BLOT_011131 [Blomia tropicalis]|nr:hypothetical protein BLOT_011131 [Blomia tropicalis]